MLKSSLLSPSNCRLRPCVRDTSSSVRNGSTIIRRFVGRCDISPHRDLFWVIANLRHDSGLPVPRVLRAGSEGLVRNEANFTSFYRFVPKLVQITISYYQTQLLIYRHLDHHAGLSTQNQRHGHLCDLDVSYAPYYISIFLKIQV